MFFFLFDVSSLPFEMLLVFNFASRERWLYVLFDRHQNEGLDIKCLYRVIHCSFNVVKSLCCVNYRPSECLEIVIPISLFSLLKATLHRNMSVSVSLFPGTHIGDHLKLLHPLRMSDKKGRLLNNPTGVMPYPFVDGGSGFYVDPNTSGKVLCIR